MAAIFLWTSFHRKIATNAQLLYLPIDHNLPVDVMLKDMDDIQLSAISFPNGNNKFTIQQSIDAGIMQLKSTGGIYSKPSKNGAKSSLPSNHGKNSKESLG